MFADMSSILSEKESGGFSVEKFTVTKNDIRAVLIDRIPPGEYVRLVKKGGMSGVIMSNTPMEKRTNREIVGRSNGNVLIAGLGIGLILLPIQEKENVTSITVLEKYQDVINLVATQLPLNEKVNIIQGDVFDYQFPRGTKFDTIYFDVWSYINSDIYQEMRELKKLYRKYKVSPKENPDAWMGCWAEWEARVGRKI